MLQYKRVENGQFLSVTPAEILAPDQPFYLFLGGLLHQNGIGFGQVLASILRDVTWQGPDRAEIPVYVALRSSDPDIGVTAKAMYDFHNQETLSPEAYALVDDLLLPGDADGDLKTTRQALSKINLVGYSYGGSLIQQAEMILGQRLGLSAAHKDVAECMGAVGAVNIGPVARPLAFKYDGSIVRLDHGVVDAPDTHGLFSQGFFLRRNDKINDDVMQQAMTGPLDQAGPLQVYGSQTTRIVVDGTGDAYLRRIGYTALGSGLLFPRIDHILDVEGHDLRLYTNRLCVENKMGVYPSIATAPTLCQAIRMMGDESSAVHNGATRQFQIEATKGFEKTAAVAKIEKNLNRLQNVFAMAVKNYQAASLADGKTIIDKTLAATQTAVSGASPKENPLRPALL